MGSVRAEFNGEVFVPIQPVDLSAGTSVEVLIPPSLREPTDEQNREWQAVLRELASSEPVFATVEDALQATRKR